MNKVTIDRDRGAPLHHQIYLVLADGIATGRYAIGEPLPTEEQLTQMFSVSRITVRRAMTSLQNDGLIERAEHRLVARTREERPAVYGLILAPGHARARWRRLRGKGLCSFSDGDYTRAYRG